MNHPNLKETALAFASIPFLVGLGVISLPIAMPIVGFAFWALGVAP